jgi:spoIIIJ-associated protein
MEEREFFGLTEAEALLKASLRLKMPLEKLRWSLLGTFAHGMKEPKVAIRVEYEEAEVGKGSSAGPALGAEIVEKVRALQDRPDPCAALILETLLAHMGIQGKVSLREEPPGQVTLTVQFEGEHPDFCRGEYRDLRPSLQYLVNRMVNDGLCNHRGQTGAVERRYILDFSGNLEARAGELRGLAEDLARRVAAGGQPVNIQLMESQDRRLLHLALVENSAVATSSWGEGRFRVLSVQPRSGQGGETRAPEEEP